MGQMTVLVMTVMKGILPHRRTVTGVNIAQEAHTASRVPAAAPPALPANTQPISAWAIATSVALAHTVWKGPVGAQHALTDTTNPMLVRIAVSSAKRVAEGVVLHLADVMGQSTPCVLAALRVSIALVVYAWPAPLARPVFQANLAAPPARAVPTLSSRVWATAIYVGLGPTVWKAPAAALPVLADPCSLVRALAVA